MDDVIDPGDAGDAEALAEGSLDAEDARVVDEPEPASGADSERLVPCEDFRTPDADRDARFLFGETDLDSYSHRAEDDDATPSEPEVP